MSASCVETQGDVDGAQGVTRLIIWIHCGNGGVHRQIREAAYSLDWREYSGHGEYPERLKSLIIIPSPLVLTRLVQENDIGAVQ